VTGTRRPAVAVVGGYGTGITFGVKKLPDTGETLLADSVRTDAGGKGSNQAVAASRLGARVALLTAIGQDDFGSAGLRLWDAEGIDAGCVRVSAGHTMIGAILVEQDGQNRIVVGPGALTELEVADVERFAPRIADADVCVVSLEIPAAVAVAALSAARAAGTLAILNPAPPVELPPAVLRGVDVLVPNRPEAVALTGSAPDTGPAVLADRLRARCDGAIVLTLGDIGALVDDGSRRLVPAIQAGAVTDTTGAGDAFTGALAAGLAHGLTVAEAAEIAVVAAAHSVGHHAVIPSLPFLAELPPGVRGRLDAGRRDVGRQDVGRQDVEWRAR
jgi:ribokinase